MAAESDASALGKLDWSGMEVETYVAAYNQSDWRDQARKARFKDPIQGGLEAVRMWGQQCDLLLSDKALTARLKASISLSSAYSSSMLVCLHLCDMHGMLSLVPCRIGQKITMSM